MNKHKLLLMTIYLLLFVYGILTIITVYQINIKIKNFPIDTSPVIHVNKNLPISWASYYDYDINGIQYSLSHDTAASRMYPRETYLKVTGIISKKSVTVRVNDVGPEPCSPDNNYHQSGDPKKCIERYLDLSSHAYQQICSTRRGLCQVTIEKL